MTDTTQPLPRNPRLYSSNTHGQMAALAAFAFVAVLIVATL